MVQAMPVLRVPGAKYFTLRYLLVALLADGESLIRGPALSDDTAVLVRALRALGARVAWEPDATPERWALRIHGCGGRLRAPAAGQIAVGNAGAVLRLLLGLGALLPEVRFETDHPASLGQRPNADLLEALTVLGIQVEAQGAAGLLPITLRGGPPRGGAVTVSGARSSQYVSALLYLAPLLPLGLDMTVSEDLRSAPLVRATLHVLAQAGIRCEAAADLRRIRVPGGQRYRAGVYTVPGDVPSAAALLAAAAVLGAPLCLADLDPAGADVRALLDALLALGIPVTGGTAAPGGSLPQPGATRSSMVGSIILAPGATLHGARINGDVLIDCVPVLAAAACVATGTTLFTRVGTLRLKESDRLGDLARALRAAGADVTALPDALRVVGHPDGLAGGTMLDGQDDHRLVQALAIAALGSHAGLTITSAHAVTKSYPDFFAALARLCPC